MTRSHGSMRSARFSASPWRTPRPGCHPPAEVGRLITRFGERGAVTAKLAGQLASASTPALPVPTKPTASPRPAATQQPAARQGGLVAEHAQVERFPRALMAPTTPSLRPARGPAMEAASAAFGWLKGELDRLGLGQDIQQGLAQAAAEQESYLREHPGEGVLLVVVLTQGRGAGDRALFRPRPQVAGVFPVRGFSDPQAARTSWERQPAFRQGGVDYLPPVFQWLDPVAPATPPTPTPSPPTP